MSGRFEEIEAMVWQTGTRDRLLVARIMRAVSDYARAADCPPEPEARAAILDEATRPGHQIGWWPT